MAMAMTVIAMDNMKRLISLSVGALLLVASVTAEGFDDVTFSPTKGAQRVEDIATVVTRAAKDNQDTDQSIAGGTQVTNQNSFPWTVRMSTGCGGTHFWPGLVLTSARCIINGLPDSVILGNIDGEDNDGTFARVKAGYYHTQFLDVYPFVNDVAVLALQWEDVDFNTIPTVPLNSDGHYPLEGSTLSMIGYGETTDDDENEDENLHKLNGFQVLSSASCVAQWSTIVGSVNITTPNHLCAQSIGETGGCTGDLGSPLFDGRIYQVGIFSFSQGECGEEDFTDAFLNVATYFNWIFETTCYAAAGPPGACFPKKDNCHHGFAVIRNSLSSANSWLRHTVSTLAGGD